MNSRAELLSVGEMGQADSLAIAGGTAGIVLMENAGRSISDAIMARTPIRPVTVLCGPGNNGGDGFVVARRLRDAGWPVTVALLGRREALKGDAALAADGWDGPIAPLTPDVIGSGDVVVDAVFGAGLTRAVEGPVAEALEAASALAALRVAVDVPSGVHGDSGAVWGTAMQADLTVTFFRKKPGHLLLPGRRLCGELAVTDIGIPEDVLSTIDPRQTENGPDQWGSSVPVPTLHGHKYDRGHALILGGAEMTGAARLAALAARRSGAGLVTIVSPKEAVAVYAADQPGTIVARDSAWPELLADPRRNAVLVGPGAGTGAGATEAARAITLGALGTGKAVILDADAITAFVGHRADLMQALTGKCVLTPHEGEFGRLFPASPEGQQGLSKLDRARAAARESGAVILLKGPDTVVAAADGRATINANAPPTLATAGSGDVLAGMILALLAQGMPAFEAASAACWMHGASAGAFGPGLIAEDIIDGIPNVLAGLYGERLTPANMTPPCQ